MANQGPLSGRTLGKRYQLGLRVGTGGFADVYVGEHIHLKAQRAIKVLHTHLANADVDKFREEARLVAQLDHPNILKVHDFDLEQGMPFLVMDYAPNGALRQRHPRGQPVPLSTIVSYLKQIADALQYAHDHKVIHRDVKPENLLLGHSNDILLSDFGIAVLAQSASQQPTQGFAGTATYAAPEQLLGKPQQASDQYALAIVVYEWLCGEPPFQGDLLAVAFQHAQAPIPSLSGRVPNLPPAVEQVVLKALAKTPPERFPQVRAFATALEHASQSAATLPPTTPAMSPPIGTAWQAPGAPTIRDSSSGNPFPLAGATSDLIPPPFSHLTVPLESTLVPAHLSKSGWFISLIAGLIGSGALCFWMISTPHYDFTWIDWVLGIDTWIALTYFFGSLFTTLWEVGHWWHLPGRNFTHVGGIAAACLFVGGWIGFQVSIGTDPAVLLVWIVGAVLLALLWIFFCLSGAWVFFWSSSPRLLSSPSSRHGWEDGSAKRWACAFGGRDGWSECLESAEIA